MNGTNDSRGRRRIDATVQAIFLDAVRGGARYRDAAATAGFALNSFHRAAKREGDFRAAWDAAVGAADTGR